MDSLLKNLEEQEISMAKKTLLNNVQSSTLGRFFRDNQGS